jgi:hypothetical protein
MRTWILCLSAVLAASVFLFLLAHKGDRIAAPAAPSDVATNQLPVAPAVVTNLSAAELGKLLIADYHSTNEHEAITSALAHQLIAEQLRTNEAFLEWASNTVKAVIVRFVKEGNIPVYGAGGLSGDALRFQKVTVDGQVGLHAEAAYDPNPKTEGPLEFIVEGGTHPTILRVRNSYRVASYQLSSQDSHRSPRTIARMDWSGAVRPLDENNLNSLARRAFLEMTGQDLASFHLTNAKIESERVLNPNSSRSGVTVSGNLTAKLYSPNDYVYPFAAFSYDDGASRQVAFSGEMMQTSAGRGEFVEVFAVVRKTEAIFELGEKFLGQGTWEQAMLDNVRSLNTEQRGQIYRRIFQH